MTDRTALLTAVATFMQHRFATTAEALDACLATIARVVGVRSAFVSHLSSEAMQLLAVWENDGCGFVAGGVVPLDTTFCQRVRATAAPLLVHDAANDVRVQQLATRTQFGIGAYLGVPITLDDGTVYGTLCLLDPEPQAFHHAQIEALTILATHLAGMIERDVLRSAVGRVERETTQDLHTTLELLDNQELLVRAIVHDLRSPLTSVRGYTDLLQQGLYGSLNPDQSNALTSINTAAEMMTRLVGDLVDVAAVETQTISLLNSAYAPDAAVLRVIDLCSTRAQSAHCDLIAEVSSALPMVVGDQLRVEQVLINLVHNALIYAAHAPITLSAAQEANYIVYTVSDHGPGITPDDQAAIWERYTRRSDRGQGLGLGLYIVRRLTEAMQGTVTLESTPGVGSCFTVRLPLLMDRPQRVKL